MGEYGVHGLFFGVPRKLGANGIEKIYEIKLIADEKAAPPRVPEPRRSAPEVPAENGTSHRVLRERGPPSRSRFSYGSRRYSDPHLRQTVAQGIPC